MKNGLKKVVKACFGYAVERLLINALKHSEINLPESVELRMERIGIDPRRRPETLTIRRIVSAYQKP